MIETLLTSLGLAAETIRWIIKFVQPKVNATPKIIKLAREDWGVDGYFTVCNKTEKPLYDVQILLWYQVEGVSESTFPLRIKKIEGQEDGPETRIGPIIVNTNVQVIDGEIKENKVKLLQLGYLDPKKCIRVFYSIESSQKGEVRVQAFSVSSEPPQTLKKTNSLGVPFKPPRDIKLTGISFLMKRES
jgi:hypothetical protein